MAIYINGCEITLTEARMVPVWIETRSGRILWHYTEKKPTRLTKEMSEQPVWHFRGTWASGSPAYDGKWVALSHAFSADGGFEEIMTAAHTLSPTAKADFERWAKDDGPPASAIFTAVPIKEVA